jgi:hypothetical protein
VYSSSLVPGTHDRLFRDGGVRATDRDFGTAPPPDEPTLAVAAAVGVDFIGHAELFDRRKSPTPPR